MVTRDFDAMLSAGVRPTFRVAGQEFTVKATLPHRKFNKLFASFANEDVDEDKATEDFFRLCLIRADRERFFALLDADNDEDDDAPVLGVQQLNAISEWLMEHYTGKSRQNSDSSTNGSDATGASPNVVSLNSRTAASA